MSSILDAVKDWSITTVLAIYAAVLSSIALAWNIRTHYERKVRLKVQGKGGMRIADPFAQPGTGGQPALLEAMLFSSHHPTSSPEALSSKYCAALKA